MKLKRVGAGLVTIMMLAFITACGSNDGNNAGSGSASGNAATTISISGSTSVGPLVEKLAEDYKGKNGSAKVEVNQIGSSAGITNAINEVSQFGMSSRDLKEEEKSQNLTETIIAHDGIAVITHKNNKVKDLTMDQVKDIFTGKIKNWSELGGDDMEIVVVSREDGSGSRDAFQEIVGYESGDLLRESIIASGNGNIKTTVAGNKHAIGFVSFEYLDESIQDVKINGVAATQENVLNGKYSLSRPFIMVHKEANITDAGQQFLDYILSDDGQKIVSGAGAIPVR